MRRDNRVPVSCNVPTLLLLARLTVRYEWVRNTLLWWMMEYGLHLPQECSRNFFSISPEDLLRVQAVGCWIHRYVRVSCLRMVS